VVWAALRCVRQAVIHLFRDVESRRQAEIFTKEVTAWERQFELHVHNTPPSIGEVAPTGHLTARECQVLESLAQGVITKSISATLVIGLPTVRNHVQKVLHKLGVHSRLEAVAYARARGLAGQIEDRT
jgi:DNA-binding NarL/FixJ family response regulator